MGLVTRVTSTSLSLKIANDLPIHLTSFIGREREMTVVKRLLRDQDVRLLTLTGPGGIGKTRMALRVAAELSDLFPDGVHFVNLAPVGDPTLVVSTIAQTLELKETGEPPLLDQLKTALRGKQFLLLLDNFEQVISAALQIVELLTFCPKLKIMVTSRAVLRVRGEQEFAVPPLIVPSPQHMSDLIAFSQYEAVALFLSRARAVKPDFQVTTANALAIAEICARLDGLPLAIELAAARIKLLPPQTLLARLSQRLAVLTSASWGIPARQQTLRNTMAWSYQLLHASEQRLFRYLSVFVGGCTLEAIEESCAALHDGAGQVLEDVTSLLDKSLLQQSEQEGGEPRLSMLETVREYGLECLRESGEAEVSRRVHALYYLSLAEEAEPHLKGTRQVEWWRRLEREQENRRAALDWLIRQGEGELALRLSGALWWFWNIRGYWDEGWRWLEAALGHPRAQERTARRAKALHGAGVIASRLGHPVARSLLEESVAIFRGLEDRCGLAASLSSLGWILSTQHDVAAGRVALEEGLALARKGGDSWILANTLRNVGEIAHSQGNFKNARLFLEESVALYRVLTDYQGLTRVLHELADVAVFEGHITQAAALAQESLTLAQELDNGPDITRALYWLAFIRSHQGDSRQAAKLYEESLALARGQSDMSQIGNALFTLGSLALAQGDLLQAETYTQESLTLLRGLRNKHRIALALSLLGEIRRRQGELAQARAICTESGLLAREAGNPYSIGWSLISLATVAADEGRLEQSAQMFGAAELWLNPSQAMDPTDRADYERAVEHVRVRLGEKDFATAWAQGRSMTLEQTLTAQDQTTMPSGSEGPPPLYPDGLTAREVDVLRLVAQGLTDAQVAQQLVISPHTVNTHLKSIYSKIQVTSRSAATRYAIEHQPP